MSKKVLIIEDDADTLDLLDHIVTNLNYECVRSRNTIPLNEVAALNPSLILLDHWLFGGEYGADYCNRLKNDNTTRHIPVIIVSFIAKLKEIADCSNADAHINKPFEVNELEDLIVNTIA
ncbi:MAG TPA: response regulator [Mucilaginibacter sp.]|jgi:CheY-like chemotaxis protein|nr:response regulator [Mucilaginibacter sp.]